MKRQLKAILTYNTPECLVNTNSCLLSNWSWTTTLGQPRLEVLIDLLNLLRCLLHLLNPLIILLQLVLESLVSELSCLLDGALVLLFIRVNEPLRSALLIRQAVCVDADAESKIFGPDEWLANLQNAGIGMAVRAWQVAGQDGFADTIHWHAFGRLDAHEGGSVVLPAVLALHVGKIEGCLVLGDELCGCTATSWILW